MGADFRLDPRFEEAISTGRELVEALEDLGDRVKRRASEIYPDDPRTGGKDLHTNITVESGVEHGRGMARVNANDFKAGWFEFGTSRVPATHALSRALEENVGPLEGGRDNA